MTVINEDLSAQIEGDFIAMLDEWFSQQETWNDALDTQIAKWYANPPPKLWPKRPYFSPSGLGSCPRELYIKARYGNKAKDGGLDKPWRGRWRKLGTLGGDLFQREMLDIEENFERLTGNMPRFKFERNEDNTPRFEEFAGANKLVEHNGERFYLYGFTDGIMNYVTDDGEIIRVGLEVKSKQGTPARTSQYSMKNAEEKHVDQVIAYSEMFDCDYFIILYVNYAKQGWFMTDEQYVKTPDIRAFCMKITDADKARLFDKAAMVTKAVRENNPPKMDLVEYTFNNFKTACARDLTEGELDELRKQAQIARHSSLPKRRIDSIVRAVEDIEKRRKGSD